MVNGPHCPSCGWTLRWVPEQNAWGCDQCRTVHPAQQSAPQAVAPSPSQPQAAWQRGPAAPAPVSSLAVPAISPAGGSFGGSAASSSPAVVRSPSQPPGIYTAPQPQRAHSPSQQGFQQARPHSSSQPNYAYGQQPPGAQPPNPYVPQPYVQQAPVSHANNNARAASQPQQPGAQPQPPNAQQPASYPGAQSQPGQPGGSYPAQAGAQSQPGGSYPGAQSQPGQPGGSYPGAQSQPGQPGGSYPGAQSQPGQPGGSYPGAQPGPGGSYPGAQPGRPGTGGDPYAAPRAGSQSGAPPAYGPGGYPIHSPAPDSVHAPEPPTPAKKSKRGLLIGLVAVGAIGAGVAVAVAMSGGKGSKGGAESKEAVTADTLAALTKPDVDALVALVAPDREREIMECTEVGEKDRDPPAKTLEKLRERLTRTADKAAGLAVELVKLGDGKTTKMEKGKEVNKGCLLTTDVALHDHELVVKVKNGDKPAKERKARISLMEVDGRWYLSSPPAIVRPGDCATAAKASIKNNEVTWKKSSLGDAAKARLEKAMTQHCTDDGWPDETITCIEDVKGSDTACTKSLSSTQLDKLTKKFEQIVLDDVKSRETPVVAETPTPPPPGIDPTAEPSSGSGSAAGSAAAGSGSAAAPEVPEELPPVCGDYKEQIAKLAGCRRIKSDIRKGLRESYDLIVDGWNRVPKKTDAIRTSIEGICKKGVDSIVDLRKSHCR